MLLDRTVYWLFRLAILLTRPLPLRVGYWFSEWIALICYWVIFPRHRKALNANLAHLLRIDDPRAVDALARRTFRNFGKYVVDFIHFPLLTRAEVVDRLRFDDWDELNEAAQSGRGILLATMHFGNWDMGAAALAAYGYKVNAIAETFPYEPMNELVQGSRRKLGMNVIGRERIGSQIFRALQRGEMLAMLMDVAEEDFGIRVEFFGAPAFVSSAPARIALRTNAWVVPAVVLRGPKDDRLMTPIIDIGLRDYAPTGDTERDVRELTRLILRSLEGVLRAHPDQWFIFRRMWQQPESSVRTAAGELAEEL